MSSTVGSLSLFPPRKSHNHGLAWENGLHACETMIVVVLMAYGGSEKRIGSQWLINIETQGLSVYCGYSVERTLPSC